MLKGFLIVPAPAVHFCPFTISFLVPTQAHLYNPAAGRFGKLILSESDLCAPAKHFWQQRCRGGGGDPREAERCPAQPQRCCSALALARPTLQLNPASSTAGAEHWKHGMEQHLHYWSGKLHLIVSILAFTTRRCRTRMCPGQLVVINKYQVFLQVFFRVYFVALQNLKQNFATLQQEMK